MSDEGDRRDAFFIKLKKNIILYCNLDYIEILYFESLFQQDLISHMHKKFNHLKSSELLDTLKN